MPLLCVTPPTLATGSPMIEATPIIEDERLSELAADQDFEFEGEVVAPPPQLAGLARWPGPTAWQNQAGDTCCIGMPPKNQGWARSAAAEGAQQWAIGMVPEVRQRYEEAWRQSNRQAHERVAEELTLDFMLNVPVVYDQLLLEILTCHQDITSDELEVMVPDPTLWSSAVANLCRRVLVYTMSLLGMEARPKFGTKSKTNTAHLGERQRPSRRLLDQFGRLDLNRMAFKGLVIDHLVSDIKSSMSEVVEAHVRRKIERGDFGAGHEPTKEEIRLCQTTPQCSVRGVGWNASTRAWVSSWLPQGTRRRICSTYSTRKFGFHQALKLCIAQRVRSEFVVYGRRRFPATALKQTAEEQSGESEAPMKGKRGRKRKTPVEVEFTLEEPPPPKRGRGRPRKYPLPQTAGIEMTLEPQLVELMGRQHGVPGI